MKKSFNRSISVMLCLLISASMPVHASSLVEAIKSGGKAGLGELCLVDKYANTVSGGGLLGASITALSKGSQAYFSKQSLFCKRGFYDVALITAEQIDAAVFEVAQGLISAYKALDFKDKDLEKLAQIKKQAIGENFSQQAAIRLDSVGPNTNLLKRRADKLSEEINQKKGYLSAEALSSLTEALGRIRAATYHQTKAIIGSYTLTDYTRSITAGPSRELFSKSLNTASQEHGVKSDFFTQLPTRAFKMAENLALIPKAIVNAEKVLDESEKRAIETAADKHEKLAAKRSKEAADAIVKQGGFEELPSVDDMLVAESAENAAVEASAQSGTSGSTNVMDGVTKSIKNIFGSFGASSKQSNKPKENRER